MVIVWWASMVGPMVTEWWALWLQYGGPYGYSMVGPMVIVWWALWL